jgi:hypothetical protein
LPFSYEDRIMNFREHFEESWQVFTEFFVPILMNTLAFLGLSLISVGILTPVLSAGYMQSLLLALREKRAPNIKDLISRIDLFFPLLAFTFLFFMAVSIGFMLLILPGIVALLSGIFFFLYLLPLMTDQKMGLIEAAKESSRMALEEPVNEHLAVVVFFIAFSSLGSASVFGSILTLAFSSLFILSVYEYRRKKTRRELTEPEA